MSYYCSYKDCSNIQRSFASKTFFHLPNDARREIWIENSGNESLKQVDPSVRRVFCEDHFDPKYLRRQFNRTILRREAIPFPCGSDVAEDIECIEMAESEDEAEQSASETPESSSEPNEVVILLNKTPNSQAKQLQNAATRNTYSKSRKPTPSKTISVPEHGKNDVQVKFIVLEDKSTEPKRMNDDENTIRTEDNESGPSSTKKSRLEPTSQQTDEFPKQDSPEENIVQLKDPVQKSPKPILLQSNTEGIVSSSEAVDSNNEETYFALSLVGILKRLPPHKRAIAKCHILSYLTELEYGSSSIS